MQLGISIIVSDIKYAYYPGKTVGNNSIDLYDILSLHNMLNFAGFRGVVCLWLQCVNTKVLT